MDDCNYRFLFGCLVLLIAGNSVSGLSNGSEDMNKCLTSVKMAQQYLKKDFVQKIAFTTLKEVCQNVMPGDHCDQMVKAALLELNNFASNKLQPKNVCYANFTVQGSGPAKLKHGPFDWICVGIVGFVRAQVLKHEDATVEMVANKTCSIFPAKWNIGPLCDELMTKVVVAGFDKIRNSFTPENICNDDEFY